MGGGEVVVWGRGAAGVMAEATVARDRCDVGWCLRRWWHWGQMRSRGGIVDRWAGELDWILVLHCWIFL